MKQNILIISFVLLVIGCTKESIGINDDNTNKDTATVTLLASIDESDTKVSINDNGNNTFSHYWQGGDEIAIFDNSGNSAVFGLYEYDTSNPSNTAYFSGEFSGTITGAIYPHNNLNAAYDGNSFTVTFPSEQTYVADSYDPASNVYVATCNNATLSFKSLMCYLRVALYSNTSNTAVSKIVISSVGGEKIAGPASVSANGEITMANSAVSSITLNCTPSVVLSSSDNPTYFYIAIPAVEVSGGLKVDVYNGDSHLWRNVSVSPTDKKNKVLKMGALEYSPLATGSEATTISGGEFNIKIKQTANSDFPGDYKEDETNITNIILETNKNMTGISGTDVSYANDGSIIATFKEGTIRIQTAASSIKANASSSYMFRNMSNLQSVDLKEFDTSVVTSAAYMFYSCPSLKTITFGDECSFGQNQNFSYMFSGCSAIESLDLTAFKYENTNNVRNCSYMFSNCNSLKSISFNSSGYTFRYVTNASNMFRSCQSLKSIDLRGVLNVSSSSGTNVNFSYMFYDCSEITEIQLNRVSYARATNVASMFQGCTKLKTITNLDYATFAAATDMSYMFYYCTSIKSLDVSNFNTSNCTDMNHMFYYCEALTNLDLRNFNTKNVTDMSYMFQYCRSLSTLDMSGENCSTESLQGTGFTRFINVCNSMTTAKFGPDFTCSNVTDYTYATQGASNHTAATIAKPFKVYCSSLMAQNLIRNVENIRKLCNNDGGTRIVFYSISNNNELSLNPSYGSVSETTTVSEPAN